MNRLRYPPALLALLLTGGFLSAWALAASGPTAYTNVNLISDIPGLAQVTDPNVKDAWGFTFAPDGPFFLVNTNSSYATTYRVNPGTDEVVKVAPDLPVPELAAFPFGGPTDVVFNDTRDFVIGQPGNTGPARYIMTGLDGTLSAWRPGMSQAVIVANNSASALAYTGLALGRNRLGHFLYAANCAQARIDVYDTNFNLVNVSGGFANPAVPGYYMPFNIQNIAGNLYVAYAVFNPNTMEEEKDPGKGIVAVFDTDGNLIRNIAIGTDAGGPYWQLNAPWGFAIAPARFGDFSGALLVGNFGDGAINAFDPSTHAFLGQLLAPSGQPLKIDGLWALGVGNGGEAGSTQKLYFSAGPNNESDGLFGYIKAH
jgi:uncharacterized protein (TIGR03118 family)